MWQRKASFLASVKQRFPTWKGLLPSKFVRISSCFCLGGIQSSVTIGQPFGLISNSAVAKGNQITVHYMKGDSSHY
ncbi:hypothetical protein FQR65_LT14347 [Abscondita terminalis]|nr:hypothetical protein FQR65_LT14347 [Abscondita terminalis]